VAGVSDYLVILKNHEGDPGADVNGDFDLTSRTAVLEVVDGAPIRAIITLDAKKGRYITKDPKIKKWDKIYLKVTDKNSKVFETVVHVKKIKKLRKGNGAQLRLICPHQSSNLMSRTIAKPNRRTSGYEAVIDAVNQLNTVLNRGVEDPTVVIESPFINASKQGIKLDQSLSNNYIYESITFQKAIEQAVKKESAPVESGGSFEWHYFRFVSKYAHPNDADLDKVAIQIFEQGYHDNGGWSNVPTVTIKKTSTTEAPSNLIDTDSSIETEVATNLIAIGNKNAGSYPVDRMRFHGAKDVHNTALLYSSGKVYAKGALVKATNGFVYEAVQQVPFGFPPPNATYWIARPFTKPSDWAIGPTYSINDVVSFGKLAWKSLQNSNTNKVPIDEPDWWVEIQYLPGVDYSPLTKDKAQYWINAMAGWSFAGTTDSDKTAVMDPNCIIKDDLHPRTWVDCVETNPTNITASILRSGNPFDTLRVCCNGVGAGDFAGNDPNGVAYSNSVIQYRGTFGDGGDWFVMYPSQTDREVVDCELGDSWIYKPCEGALSYVDGSGVCLIGSRNSGWVKGAYALLDIGGISLAHFTSGLHFECLHTVKRTGTDVEVGNEEIITEDGSSTSAVFVNFTPTGASASDNKPSAIFAGLNFAFPWPRNSNSAPHGAVSIGEQIDLNKFDLDNMHQNSIGGRDWFGPEVEEFYPIQGFNFFELFQEFLTGGLLALAGDYSMGLWLADSEDNVVTMEYTHQRNNDTSPQGPKLGKIQIYRGVPGVANFSPARQPEVLDIFDQKSVVRGGIYTKDSFDESGRYKASFANLNGVFGRFAQSEKLHLAIDSFSMTKPLIATNIRGAKPSRNLETAKIREESVVSYAQLKNLVKSTELVMAFEAEDWPINTALRCDVGFGDPMYYTDDELIDETTDAKPNTLKLVADEITYVMSKTSQGPGGSTRNIKARTRIWP